MRHQRPSLPVVKFSIPPSKGVPWVAIGAIAQAVAALVTLGLAMVAFSEFRFSKSTTEFQNRPWFQVRCHLAERPVSSGHRAGRGSEWPSDENEAGHGPGSDSEMPWGFSGQDDGEQMETDVFRLVNTAKNIGPGFATGVRVISWFSSSPLRELKGLRDTCLRSPSAKLYFPEEGRLLRPLVERGDSCVWEQVFAPLVIQLKHVADSTGDTVLNVGVRVPLYLHVVCVYGGMLAARQYCEEHVLSMPAASVREMTQYLAGFVPSTNDQSRYSKYDLDQWTLANMLAEGSGFESAGDDVSATECAVHYGTIERGRVYWEDARGRQF